METKLMHSRTKDWRRGTDYKGAAEGKLGVMELDFIIIVVVDT
jgi:hypothetical protein